MDYKKRFIDLVVGWPGSVNDHRIWSNSQLYKELETFLSDLPSSSVQTVSSLQNGTVHVETIPPLILGDSAYTNTKQMVTTFGVTECSRCPITKQLNKKLSSVRYSVENAFGICKGRFRVLNRALECAGEDVERAIILIVAIFTVHNFLIDEKDQTEVEPVARRRNETFVTRGQEEEILGDVQSSTTREIQIGRAHV